MNIFKLANLIENKYNLLKIAQSDNISQDALDVIKEIVDRSRFDDLRWVIRLYDSNARLDGFHNEIESIYGELKSISDAIDISESSGEKFSLSKEDLIDKLEKIRAIIISLKFSQGIDTFNERHEEFFHLAEVYWASWRSQNQIDRNVGYRMLTRLKEYLSSISDNILEQVYPKLNILKKYDRETDSYTDKIVHNKIDQEYTEPIQTTEYENVLRTFNHILNVPIDEKNWWNLYLDHDSKEAIRRAFRAYLRPGAGIEGTSLADKQIAEGGVYGPRVTTKRPTGLGKDDFEIVSHRKVITKENLDALRRAADQIKMRRMEMGELDPSVEFMREKEKKLYEEQKRLYQPQFLAEQQAEQEAAALQTDLSLKDAKIKRKLKNDSFDESVYQRKWLKLSDKIRSGLSYATFLQLLSLNNIDYNKVTKDDKSIIKFVKLIKDKGFDAALTEFKSENENAPKNEIEEDVASEERVANINKRIGLLMKLSGLRG